MDDSVPARDCLCCTGKFGEVVDPGKLAARIWCKELGCIAFAEEHHLKRTVGNASVRVRCHVIEKLAYARDSVIGWGGMLSSDVA